MSKLALSILCVLVVALVFKLTRLTFVAPAIQRATTPIERSPTPIERSPTPIERAPTPIERAPTPIEQAPPAIQPVTPAVQRVQHLDGAIALLRHSTLESRAIPNERLVRAFGIENSFTTTSPEFNRDFVTKSQKSLRITDDYFNTFTGRAQLIFCQMYGKGAKVTPLTEIVQEFVFRVTLVKFFPHLQDPEQNDVRAITQNINVRWLGSKDPTALFSPTQFGSQGALRSAIRRVFGLPGDPDTLLESHSNPLNTILPAYEVLWQVVLSGFLELLIHSPRYYKDRVGSNWARFLHGRTQASFKDSTNNLSISHIVAEIPRLCPPTKRIKRFHNGQLYDIDVEYLQRDVNIWGSDAEVFRPERWSEKTEEQERAYMPFGSGKFVCPSKRVTGPMLIGMLVGIMMEWQPCFDIKGENGEPVVFGNGPLDSGRSAHLGLRFHRH